MDQNEQIAAFEADLKALIYRYRSEFELTVAAAIGTLELAKLDLYCEAKGVVTDTEWCSVRSITEIQNLPRKGACDER